MSGYVRVIGVMVFGCIVATMMVFRPDAQILVVAVVSGVTVYCNATSRVVYGSTALLTLMEVGYGGDVGGTPLAYLGAVVLFLSVRRFVALPLWSARDGWRVIDALSTVMLSVLFFGVVCVCAILIGDALFGYDAVTMRLRALGAISFLRAPLIVCAVTCVALRRMAIPFRREILFGI